ncbi:MAG: ABC transporter ATP-binding protein [Candidatus Pacebacteria bacterium]|nr:ABC transporter ATP-binding protein [Candidatus Paceibacterota bacterium]MBP9842417.1 ABC transporter ATP-binding protein [Candidatus Paceibacterota bacterium]
MFKNQEKQAQIPQTPFKFLVYISKPYKWKALLAASIVVVAAVLGQSINLIFKWIVEAVEKGDASSAIALGLLYPLVSFIIQLMWRASGVVGVIWIASAMKRANDELFAMALNHSHSYFSNRFAGSLLNKVGNVVGAIDNVISDLLWSYLSTSISLAVTFFFIYRVDKLSALIFFGLIVSLIMLNRAMMSQKQELSKQTAASSSKLRGAIVDVFTNVSAVRQFSRQIHEQERQEVLSTDWKDFRKKNWLFSEMTLALNSLVLFVFASGMFYVLVNRWQEGAISTADFVFILALMSQLVGTLIFIGRVMTNYARIVGELEEGLEEIVVPYEIVDVLSAAPLVVTRGAIDWNSVGFEFGENKVFKNFNLTIKAGERVGLVGHSGAGKTTFVSLLLRQHDVTGGCIEIDGQDIACVTQDSLRMNIAVVPQEPLLFHRTIRENIAYGKDDATEAEVIEVAKKAKAHDFIIKLEHGYDTLVGERGIKLSGGQKQRVAIARAMLKDAPILVLDEATSALDSESEVAIQTALHELMVGKTVVAIAHRLSTLREMDRIIVLENGAIIEDGTHESLKEAGGVYQRLWEHQAGGFLVE